MARKTYTREFKIQAVRMMTVDGLSVAEVARRLGVGEGCLRVWRDAAAKQGDDAFPGQGNLTAEQDELRRLRLEVTRLRAERDLLEKSRGLLRQPAELTFRFIRDHLGEWPTAWMCAALDVSESGYHAWAARPASQAEQRRDRLVAAIRQIHDEVKQRYGSPRMTAELNARGYACTENTVAKLMRENGLRAKTSRRFVRTTDSRHGLPVAANLLDRAFEPDGPNVAWGADITYIPTADGWLFLAVVEDLFSRMSYSKSVGWSMDETMTSRLVVDALDMALSRRKPGAGLLAHSDRGSQYASLHYRQLLARHGIACSMSGVAQCWDNAPVESFFASLKKELVHHEKYTSREEAKASIFAYVESFYNRVRRHSSLGFLSPWEFERAHNPDHP